MKPLPLPAPSGQPGLRAATTPPRHGVVTVHAHFHRADQHDPWSGRLDPALADGRVPVEIVLRDCYRANAAARRTDPAGDIVGVVNNYESIGWDVSPSLVDWLADASPWTLRQMVDADASQVARVGRGAALAHPYVHAILPLASPPDRRTLVRWGIGHFRHTFGREPDGMWLPETAVDDATLTTLAEEGVGCTIMTPAQVAAVRSGDGDTWSSATAIELRRPYRYVLGDGRAVTCWFGDAGYSETVAFGDALVDGWALGTRMAAEVDRGEVLSLVVDGETFGVHHQRGDMALAALVAAVGAASGASVLPHGALGPADDGAPEVRLNAPSARSCRHGLERWRSDCGDTVPGNPTWNQRWRRPLRNALDWLVEQVGTLLEAIGRKLFDDPWSARDQYVDVLVDPRASTRRRFLRDHGARPSSGVAAFSLLEVQRHALAALDSGAWFGADPADPATIRALRHADRATQLAGAAFGTDLASPLRARLAPLRGNRLDLATADELWDHYVVRSRTDASTVARAAALRRTVGTSGVSGRRWQVRAMGAEQASFRGRQACAARYVVTDRATGARETHALVTVDDGRGRLDGIEVDSATIGDLAEVAQRASRRGVALLDGTEVFGLAELPVLDRREVLARYMDVIVRNGPGRIGPEAGIAIIGSLTELDLDVPPILADAVAGSLANRFRTLLDRPVIDEPAAVRLLSDGMALAWVSDQKLAAVIDDALADAVGAPPRSRASAAAGPPGGDRALAGGGALPATGYLRRLAVLARLAARSSRPAPSIWWVQNAVVGWLQPPPAGDPDDTVEALIELAAAVGVGTALGPMATARTKGT